MVNIAGERPKPEPVRHHLEVHRHREVGAAVVPVVENADAGATGVFAGNLDRVFDGLGARVEQNRLFGKVARGVLGEQFAEANVRLVSVNPEKGVRESLRLLVGSLGHRIIGMTDGIDSDAAPEIDDLVAIHVDKNGSLGAVNVDREGGGNPDGNNFVAALVKGE